MPGNFFGESEFCLRFSKKLTFEAINARLSTLIYYKLQSMVVDGYYRSLCNYIKSKSGTLIGGLIVDLSEFDWIEK
jgi:O-acetylhomoserine/O-acetylserine sulfhydrylase-like pyridoxal-dependent enzyme